jgi:hypothetical protein
MLETDVARPAVEHFKRLGYAVHSEVQTIFGRADIVAVKLPSELIVIEAKARFGFDVVAQAARWHGHATKIYVLTPGSFRPTKMTGDEYTLLREVMTWKKIGWIEVFESRINFRRDAPLQEKVNLETVMSSLVPEQIDGVEAGSRGGGYYTKYRGTCNKIAAYLRDHPGSTISEVLLNITHHYSSLASAKNSLARSAERGVIHGVRSERRKGGELVLFVDDGVQVAAE